MSHFDTRSLHHCKRNTNLDTHRQLEERKKKKEKRKEIKGKKEDNSPHRIYFCFVIMVFWQLNSLISTSVAWNIIQYKKTLYVGRPVVFVNMNATRMTELTKLGPIFKTLIRWMRIKPAGQSYTICRRSNQLTTFQQMEDPTTGLQVLIKATAFGVNMLKRYTKAWSSNIWGGTEQNCCTRSRVKW